MKGSSSSWNQHLQWKRGGKKDKEDNIRLLIQILSDLLPEPSLLNRKQ
jgi:hypothetical protein